MGLGREYEPPNYEEEANWYSKLYDRKVEENKNLRKRVQELEKELSKLKGESK